MGTTVALDIGSSAIAGVELKSARGRVSLTRAAVETLPPGLVREGEVIDPEGLAGEIKRVWREGRFTGRRLRLGVANQRVVVRTIEMPALEDGPEKRAAVTFQAGEQIPIPADATVVDYQPIMRYDTPEGPRERLIVVVAHREMVEELVSAVRAAGLVPTGIDLEAFAILRALLPPPSVIDEGSPDVPAVAVCHVGAEITNMMVAVDRQCHFTRLVAFGGNRLTEAVSERTGLPADEAEAVKVACGLLGDAPGDADPDMLAGVRHALALAARPLADEMGRSLEYYRGQEDARPISGLVLAGGSSLCRGLDRYLSQALGLQVRVGDPLAGLDVGSSVDPAVAARAAVALGLALDAPERR